MADSAEMPLKVSRLLERLERCDLTIQEGKSSKGACDYCHAWRISGSKAMGHSHADLMATLTTLRVGYLGLFYQLVVELGLASYEMPCCDNI